MTATTVLLGVPILLGLLSACSKSRPVRASGGEEQEPATTVGIATVARKPMMRDLTVSSELVPFQEIDVYAKESGYVKELKVDYGTRVHAGQLMAVLEIPELEIQLQQDAAAIQTAADQVNHANHELNRLEAQHKVADLQYQRIDGVAKKQPGLVAQMEVDDLQGKALALEAQVEAGKSAVDAAQGRLDSAKAKLQHDQVLLDYAQIKAPFAGVITQRYANLGTLVQSGTNSSTQAMPLVRLSQDDVFRLVIPVPEAYVKYIHLNDPVKVRVASLDRVFPGKVARFSDELNKDTRTMHTEVDVPNTSGALMQGLFAEATLTLDRHNDALVAPLEAVSQAGQQTTILLVDGNNVIQQRQIQIGIETATDAEVLSGLNEGDRVVVSDRSGLKAGTHVKPQPVESVQYQDDTAAK
jgi:RND family efflux transporter MFP subunit